MSMDIPRKSVAIKAVALFSFMLAAVGQFGFQDQGPQLQIETATDIKETAPDAVFRLAVAIEISDGWHVNSHKPLDSFLIPTTLSFDDTTIFSVEEVVYPTHVELKFPFSEDMMAVYEKKFIIGVHLRCKPETLPGKYILKGALSYQACNNTQCSAPKTEAVEIEIPVAAVQVPASGQSPLLGKVKWTVSTPENIAKASETTPEAPLATTSATEGWQKQAENFEVVGRLDGYANKADFLAFLDRTEQGKGLENNLLAEKQWWLVLVLILLGGLALNLTPCVLPLIPINVGIIGAGARAGSKLRGFMLGLAYGIAIALVYGLLGLVVVLGISSTFGALNATPWFNAAIAVLFILLALAMFDLIHIDFSKYQAKVSIRKNEKGRFAIAFFMGAISALLAGACVAPVVIYTIVYAQDQFAKGYTLALLLPFTLGVGMALPWPFLGAGLSFLPKPGAWMNRVKQAFGVFILLFAAYYGYMAYTLYQSNSAAEDYIVSDVETVWTASLAEGLATAQKDQKYAIIDFWATWCKNCNVMDKKVLKDPEVLHRLEDYVKIKFQAEDPKDPITAAVMKHYQVKGLPAFIIVRPVK